jgi:cobalt/nickel transport system permease protein
MTLRLDLLRSPDSSLSRLDSRWKLAGIALAMAAVLALRNPLILTIAFAACLLLALVGQVSIRWLLRRLGEVTLFLSPFALLLPFLTTGDGHHWLAAAVRLYARGLSVITLALVLLSTSPLPATFKAAHALRFPTLLLHVVMLTYRYVFVLGQELRRMRTSLRVRGYRIRANAHTYRTIAHVAGTLFVRGYERAERVGQAMRCRGFDGRFRSLMEFRTRRADLVFFALVVGTATGLCVWDYAS